MRRFFILLAVGVALYFAYDEVNKYMAENSSIQKPGSTVNAGVQAVYDLSRVTSAVQEGGAKVITPLELANRYLEAHRKEWNLQTYHEFRPVEFRTPLGTKIKYSIFQDDIPILNMEISLQIEGDMTVSKVENNYTPVERALIQKKEVRIEDVLPLVSDRFRSLEDSKATTPPVLVVLTGTKVPQLAYTLTVVDKADKDAVVQILLRSSDGQVIGKTKARVEF